MGYNLAEAKTSQFGGKTGLRVGLEGEGKPTIDSKVLLTEESNEEATECQWERGVVLMK